MKKTKKLTLPPIPVNHLTIKEFEELRYHIKRITGYSVIMNIVDKKTKKKIAKL
jgi:hypothetical protein